MALRAADVGGRDSARRDGAARRPLSRRHGGAAAPRSSRAVRLYAGVRPIRLFTGAPTPLADPRATDDRLRAGARIHRRLVRFTHDDPPRGDDAVLDTMRITRRTRERLFTFAFELARRGASAKRPPGTRDLRRQGERDPVDGVSSDRYFSRSRRAHPDVARRLRLRRRGRPRAGAVAVGVRRPGHREHVRRHPVGRGRGLIGGMGMAPSADIGDRHARVPALPRHRARHRRPRPRQSDGHDPVGGDDARVARRAARRCGVRDAPPACSGARSRPRSPRARW